MKKVPYIFHNAYKDILIIYINKKLWSREMGDLCPYY